MYKEDDQRRSSPRTTKSRVTLRRLIQAFGGTAAEGLFAMKASPNEQTPRYLGEGLGRGSEP